MRPGTWITTGIALIAAFGPAEAQLFKVDTFTLYGDFRLRAETDWDSQNASGVERMDRTRLRVRARLGFLFDPTEHLRFEMRVRTGQEGSQQSPHITILDFDDNDTGEASVDFDRWSLRGTFGGFTTWAGRNDLPIWKQDELLFDDDVTMPGVAAGWETDAGKGKLKLAGGYFNLPVGMTQFSGNLGLGQIAYLPEAGKVKLAFALGAYLFEPNPTDPDAATLLQGNGSRDYTIYAASVQAKWNVAERPLSLGADIMYNAEDYSPTDPDAVTAANFDETDGYVLLATYGSLDKAKAWLVGYYYARLETLAVNNSYAQDDWVRWGNATQTTSSNMKGHEARFAWAFNPKMNLMARLYLVEAITSVEDGNRFRVDFNYRF